MSAKLLKLFYITFILVCCFLVAAKLFSVAENILINNEDVTPFNTGWTYSVNGEERKGEMLELPAKLENVGKNDIVAIKNKLPDEYREGMTICFRSVQQFIKVCVNGEVVYSYGYDSIRPFGKAPGSVWNFVRLDKSTQGGEIIIETSSPYDSYSNNVNMINYGSKNSNVFYIVLPNSFGLLMSVLILAFSCAILLIYLFFRKEEYSEVVLLIGMFTFIGGVWSLAETRLLQLFTSNQYFVTLMSFSALMLLPIPLLLFIAKTHSFRNKKILYVFVTIASIATLICTGLQIFKVYDLIETSLISIGILLTSMIVVVVMILIEIFLYKNKGIILIGTGTCALVILASLDYMRFIGRFTGDNAFFFRLGVLVYIGILAIIATRQIVNMKTQNLKMDVLEDLAYADLLTNLRNRGAFETEMETYRENSERCKDLFIGIFDINDLKIVNDTKGHKVGDSMLIKSAECLKLVFEGYDKIYRTGGDEFAVIISNMNGNLLKTLMDRFEVEAEKSKFQDGYNLEIAHGFAVFDPEIDKDVDELYVRADSLMYDRKSEMKRKMGRRDSD